jgi:ubiquitin carboxyl-terminal hydrolase 7
MDVLDEKVNGGPSMEVDDVVSVRDRKPFLIIYEIPLNVVVALHSDEAFAAKNMPELGHDVKDFKVFTWRLNNWKKLDKKLTSPDFECGGHKWWVISWLCLVMDKWREPVFF